MIQVRLPDDKQRRLVFYLAMEEYVAANISRMLAESNQLESHDLFFLWRVSPTVIFGRNQDIEAEVNLDYCRSHNVEFYRRKSGGGCVYADWGNIMLSYVTTDTNVEAVFCRYLDNLASALQDLGFNAVKTEHNDVLVDGRKVSGNAFYKLPESSIVHGTLLYDVDFDEMSRSITPSQEKLQIHGVKSVRQRVANLRKLMDKDSDFSIEDLLAHLTDTFSTGEILLSESAIREIEEVEQSYLAPSFIMGK